MALIFNSKTFSLITKEISNGNPRWGMFMANQYMTKNDPLRLALAAKARQVGMQEGDPIDYAALSGDLASEAIQIGKKSLFSNRSIPKNGRKLRSAQRRGPKSRGRSLFRVQFNKPLISLSEINKSRTLLRTGVGI